MLTSRLALASFFRDPGSGTGKKLLQVIDAVVRRCGGGPKKRSLVV